MGKGFMDYKTYDTSKGFGSRSKWQDAFEQRMNFRINTQEETDSRKDLYSSLYDCSTAQELKKEYYRLMVIYHPDKNGNSEESKIIAQAINDIYFKLKDKL